MLQADHIKAYHVLQVLDEISKSNIILPEWINKVLHYSWRGLPRRWGCIYPKPFNADDILWLIKSDLDKLEDLVSDNIIKSISGLLEVACRDSDKKQIEYKIKRASDYYYPGCYVYA